MAALTFDLHRHLEGSIRAETLLEIAREFRVPRVSDDLAIFRRYVEMAPEDPRTFRVFLSKFNGIKPFWVDRRAIEWAARASVSDAADEGVRHLELRFNPTFFCLERGFAPREAAEWIADAARAEARARGLTVKFVACLIRHLPPEVNLPTLEIALEGGLYAGLDLAGDESVSDGLDYVGAFRSAAERGLGITVHAGELWGTGRHISEAVERFGARRIGHGTCAFRDPRLLDLCIGSGVTFEICPTSSSMTGQVTGIHPAGIARGARIVVGTDDPAIYGTSLPKEADKAAGSGLMIADLNKAARAAAF